MIRVIAGGKKNQKWVEEAMNEYNERLRKPFDVHFETIEEKSLDRKLKKWDFKPDEFVILADERGQNITSPEFSKMLMKSFTSGKSVTIIIGGAYGVDEEARRKADFLWSFSKLVFPHQLMRVMVLEQIYRAQEISKGSGYHH